MHKGYFEGILQLRNPNKEVVDYIKKEIKKKEKVSISDIKKVRGGLDFYLTSNKYLLKLGEILQKQFGGILKTSSKLHTRSRQTSKEVHRVNVLFRAMDFKKNDVILINNQLIKIKSMGKKIQGINLEDNKKKIFEYSEKIEVLKRHDTVVSKIKPKIEVIHPETFQSIETINKKTTVPGKKIKVVIEKNKVYIA